MKGGADVNGLDIEATCEHLALLKVVKIMCQHDLNSLTDNQLYRIYQDNYFPDEFKQIVMSASPEDL